VVEVACELTPNNSTTCINPKLEPNPPPSLSVCLCVFLFLCVCDCVCFCLCLCLFLSVSVSASLIIAILRQKQNKQLQRNRKKGFTEQKNKRWDFSLVRREERERERWGKTTLPRNGIWTMVSTGWSSQCRRRP
jgi:hypothetical protein